MRERGFSARRLRHGDGETKNAPRLAAAAYDFACRNTRRLSCTEARMAEAVTESLPNLKTGSPSKTGDAMEARKHAVFKAIWRQKPCVVIKRTGAFARAVAVSVDCLAVHCAHDREELLCVLLFAALGVLFKLSNPQGARPRSDRPRCGGRESKFLQVRVAAHLRLLRLAH